MLIARLDEYLVYSQPQWSSRYSVRKDFGYQPCYLILCSEEADHTYIMEKKKGSICKVQPNGGVQTVDLKDKRSAHSFSSTLASC